MFSRGFKHLPDVAAQQSPHRNEGAGPGMGHSSLVIVKVYPSPSGYYAIANAVTRLHSRF